MTKATMKSPLKFILGIILLPLLLPIWFIVAERRHSRGRKRERQSIRKAARYNKSHEAREEVETRTTTAPGIGAASSARGGEVGPSAGEGTV
jgi:hypothetical protein